MDRSSLKDILTAFSPRGDYLAISLGDGRVKVWDTVNGLLHNEFADIVSSANKLSFSGSLQNGHLALEYTSIAWGFRPTTDAKGKKKNNKGGLSLLALGTGSGDVLVWDTTVGELKWRTNDCNVGGVRTVAFAKNGQSLFCAGVDGFVCELDSSSGEVLGKFRASKTTVSSLSISTGGDLLLAGTSEIKLFDLSSKKRLRKFTGHPVSVRTLAFTEDGKYALSTGVGDRHVAVWNCKEAKQNEGAVCALSMEHPAVAIDCSSFQGDEGTYRILAVSETGLAYVWQAEKVESLPKLQPIKVSVSSVSGKTSNLAKGKGSWKPCVLAAKLIQGRGDALGSLLVAYGSVARPSFERLLLDNDSDVILGASQNGALLLSEKHSHQITSQVGPQEVTVLGPDNAADAVFPRAKLESEQVIKTHSKKKRARNDLSEVADSQLGDANADKPATEEMFQAEMDEGEEPTMEERLIALGLVEEKRKNASDTIAELPKTDSVEVLLNQALQSDDNTLVERCLAISDEKVISKTVRRLQDLSAAKLLLVLISKIQARPRRGLNIIPWVQLILLHHAAFIMSNPSMQSSLASLYQMIDARVSVVRPLLSLSGRLDLIMSQISASESRDMTSHAVVYEEEDTEQEVEDVMGEDSEGSDLSERDVDDLEVSSDKDIHVQGKGLDQGHDESDEEEDDL